MKTLYVIIMIFVSTIYCNSQGIVYELTEGSKKELLSHNIRHVFDTENILSVTEIIHLDDYISKFHEKSNKDLLVFTVKSILPFNNMLDYGAYIRSFYDLEDPELIIMVISKELRQVVISTSDKAMAIMTNELCDEVIKESMIPYFKKDLHYLGIKNGIEEIINKW